MAGEQRKDWRPSWSLDCEVRDNVSSVLQTLSPEKLQTEVVKALNNTRSLFSEFSPEENGEGPTEKILHAVLAVRSTTFIASLREVVKNLITHFCANPRAPLCDPKILFPLAIDLNVTGCASSITRLCEDEATFASLPPSVQKEIINPPLLLGQGVPADFWRNLLSLSPDHFSLAAFSALWVEHFEDAMDILPLLPHSFQFLTDLGSALPTLSEITPLNGKRTEILLAKVAAKPSPAGSVVRKAVEFSC